MKGQGGGGSPEKFANRQIRKEDYSRGNTIGVSAEAIKFVLVTWRKKNAGNHWVLVCERRLKRGEICPEVLCKAQACLAKSTSKNHAEYPYYIRKNETVFQPGQCSGVAISKSCLLLQNDTFTAMIAGNPRPAGTTMKKMIRATTSDKAHAKKYTLQRCRRTLVPGILRG
ncbi:hypothetical protein XU18_1428 [Perkinsela sp. CCAP 1560/4]|nr:hypothetical protein XU18_1428 [Perkinsela sp. CCAP 1560/4]|eukprot:KNH07996.1 hypothetical protein XU18_1428 [Perkinsela sp. CCAP 1560/4]